MQNCSNCALYSTKCEYASARRKSGPPKGYTRKTSKNAITRPASLPSPSDLQLVMQSQRAQQSTEAQQISHEEKVTSDRHPTQALSYHHIPINSISVPAVQQYAPPPGPPTNITSWDTLFTPWVNGMPPPINCKSPPILSGTHPAEVLLP